MQNAEKIPALGITVAKIDDQLRQTFGIDGDVNGIVVTDVDGNGTAADQGIKPGDVIVAESQEKLTSPSQLATKIKEAKAAGRKSLLLLVESDNGLRFVAIRIDRG